jgi:hypothetical protein
MTVTLLEQKEITEVLTSFGFNGKDQEVYLALLGQGQTTLTPLAKVLGLPVSTVQSSVQRLIDHTKERKEFSRDRLGLRALFPMPRHVKQLISRQNAAIFRHADENQAVEKNLHHTVEVVGVQIRVRLENRFG